MSHRVDHYFDDLPVKTDRGYTVNLSGKVSLDIDDDGDGYYVSDVSDIDITGYSRPGGKVIDIEVVASPDRISKMIPFIVPIAVREFREQYEIGKIHDDERDSAEYQRRMRSMYDDYRG